MPSSLIFGMNDAGFVVLGLNNYDYSNNNTVMNLLNTIGEDTNVFVISHKGDQLLDKFKSVIKFQKYLN